MGIDRQSEMSAEETDAFLSAQETGVVSLARQNEPYAIPISYGYNASARQFYLRLVSTPVSEKRTYLESEPLARLVVYTEGDDTYRSVLAIGTLAQIEPDELSTDDIQQYGSTRRPLFEIWAEQKEELNIDLYRLDPDRLSGRFVEVSR